MNTQQRKLIAAVSLCAVIAAPNIASAVAVSGQGTWESSLQGRDLDGNLSTFEAYYDATLNITWLADANAAGTSMDWFNANAWAANLDLVGFTAWRLPTLGPINGNAFNTDFSNNATSDVGSAPTTTDGTNGGWRDGNGTPVSEMGHMFYVTLGNHGDCAIDNSNPSTCAGQIGYTATNPGPFSNIQPDLGYWSSLEFDSSYAWRFSFGQGFQSFRNPGGKSNTSFFAWAVHDGDVGTAIPSAVPVPAAAWLFSSGVLVLLSMRAKRRR